MTDTPQTETQGVRFPMLQGILPIDRSMVFADIVAGMTLAVWVPGPFSLGAWIAGAVLVGFAFLLRGSVQAEAAPVAT